jgi:hypothetical protein
VVPEELPTFSITSTTSIPSKTCPKTTCLAQVEGRRKAFEGSGRLYYSVVCQVAHDESTEISPVHLTDLVHGWLGNKLEMDYLRQSLERKSGSMAECHQMMIHTTVSTVGRTWDGVAARGLRLAQEIDQVLDKMQK